MDVETKMEIIKRPPTEEIITEEDLRNLLETNDHPEHYQGFEISGLLHLGTLLMSGNKINDLAEAGFKVKVFLADWHTFINNKLGGDWDRIVKASKYFAEAFKFYCPKVEIILGSEFYHHNDEYWKDVIRFSKKISLARTMRCLTIMGRSEREKIEFGQLLYPPMQAVDVKYIGRDLVNRVLASLFRDRGVKILDNYQLNIGGNTDFLNMTVEERLRTKRISKTEAVTSLIPYELKTRIGPSDYVPFLRDKKVCYIHMSGLNFGSLKLTLDLKLVVEDSPNSGGVMLDVIRAVKIARDRGVGGPLISISAYSFKHPPVQVDDAIAKTWVEEFIEGKREK